MISRVNADIYGNGARTALRCRQAVQKFFFGDPAMASAHFPLDERDHGIASADGERTDLQKSEKDPYEHLQAFPNHFYKGGE